MFTRAWSRALMARAAPVKAATVRAMPSGIRGSSRKRRKMRCVVVSWREGSWSKLDGRGWLEGIVKVVLGVSSYAPLAEGEA